MAPAADETTVLADRTKEHSATNPADPYILAIDRIRVAIIRHRTNRESLGETKDDSGFIDDSHRSQSPVGFTNESQTIEDIEGILTELERVHGIPPPKLSHDSSKIEADMASTADGQVVQVPAAVIEAPWPTQDVATRLHPENFEIYNCHIDKIAIFENDLTKAFNNSKRAEVKYTKVEVLLLTWEAGRYDDIREEVEEDTVALLELFDEVNYDVTSISISRDKRKGWVKLQRALSKFVEKYEDYENDDVLFLVHYNGHGSIRNRKSYWHPTGAAAKRSDPSDPSSEQNGPSIEYDDVRKIFDSVINQDILFILDCCYAGAASRSKGPSNTKELLAACGSEDRTPATDSFTARFVNCFRAQLDSDPVFQVGWLFESITDISQKPTPLHVNLNKSPTSICLSSLARPKTEEPLAVTSSGLSNDSLSPGAMLGVGDPSSATSSKALSTFSNDNDVSDGNTRPTSAQGGQLPEPKHWKYEVLITVKLHGDIVPSSRGWHLDFPATQVDGKNSTVKVRALALTKSTLLLVTLPIRCWILLPANPAYTFIDFVKTDSYLNVPQAVPGLAPSSSPVTGSVQRSDSDNSNKAPDNLLHIIAAIKDFFDKHHHDMKEKPGPIRRIQSKIGLHSSSHRFESDPRYGYIRHIMQRLVVSRDDNGESHFSYDLHFREEKKLFERCKKHLIKEVLHSAASNNKNELENTVSAELDQLEREVLELAEVDKKRPIFEPLKSESVKPKPQHTKRPSVSHLSKHEAIPEDAEVKGGRSKPGTDSGLPRTESTLSMKKVPRTSSMKSQSGPRTDSRPLLNYLGRMISRDSTRSNTSVQSPMHSPKVTGHSSGISAGA